MTDISRINQAQIRILKGILLEQKSDDKSKDLLGVTCYILANSKKNHVSISTFLDNIAFLESHDLVKLIPYKSKRLSEKQKKSGKKRRVKHPYVITDLGFFILLKNLEVNKSKDISLKYVQRFIPLIDQIFWKKLEQKIGIAFPFTILFMAISGIDVIPMRKNKKPITKIRTEIPLYGSRLIVFNDVTGRTYLMQHLAYIFYFLLIYYFHSPDFLFTVWQFPKNFNIKPYPGKLLEFKKSGKTLKKELEKIILNNPTLLQYFQENSKALDTYLKNCVEYLHEDMNFLYEK